MTVPQTPQNGGFNNGGNYPPNGFPGGMNPYPQKKGLSTTAKVLIGVAIGIALLCGGCATFLVVAGDEIVDEVDRGIFLAEPGVTDVVRCSVEDDGTGAFTGRAEVEVKNPDRPRSIVNITVGFFDSNNTQVATAETTFNNLQVNQVARAEAVATDLPAEVTCRVVDVNFK